MLQVAVGARDRCVGGSAKLLALVVAIGAGAVVLRLAEGRQCAHHDAQKSAQKAPVEYHCKTPRKQESKTS
jgi:hypothetical protein